MTCLICCIGVGKGTWSDVSSLISSENWEKVFIVMGDFGNEKFSHQKDFEKILVAEEDDIDSIKQKIIEALKGKILDTEVAVNIESGSGKEHMALISAVISSGLGFRLLKAADNGWKEI